MFLPTLCDFVTYCFDLKAYCNSALFMMNTTFSLTCGDDGSVNVCVCVCVNVCMCIEKVVKVTPCCVCSLNE